jgi:hypothetical protein
MSNLGNDADNDTDTTDGPDAGESKPARKRTTRAKTKGEQAATGAAPAQDAEDKDNDAPAPEATAAPAAEEQPATDDSETEAAEAEEEDESNLLRREEFARRVGFRPAELITFERRGWLRPALRREGAALYRASDAATTRQELLERIREDADARARGRRY